MKGEAYNPHFNANKPDYLGEAEREVYENYLGDNLSIDKFRELRSAAYKDYEKLPADAKKETLNYFLAHIGNLISAREGKRQLEEKRHKK